jgi:hypothetical protein
MAEKTLASFDSRTQVGTGLSALAAVHNVIACYKMIYEEKKRATEQLLLANFSRKVNWKHEHQRKLASMSAEYKEPNASIPAVEAKPVATFKVISHTQSHTLLVHSTIHFTVMASFKCIFSLIPQLLYELYRM